MRHGWITTLRRDGSPRTSRVWFVESGGGIWLATAEANRKVADIRRDARSTFAIEGCHGAQAMTASIEPIDSELGVLASFKRDYDGWDAADSAVDGPRVLIRLTPASHVSL
ncbi:pyridoxamine 5'-phosphate oxidase family protein [Agromyces cerinus]|uniref:Pyridoxamine 5'-phosphate oxidase n=1 Tax=Agromyces cerinus subsp. cerinus TaxID=232089 RepID=A0A1N6E2T7_9MICO|nr:pyridoxamine 5'-phosphate oxidase family protein [Agromyces cerinus]SIN77301.1 Pyridoxamine 5'-phosphate oxidase [Agromyces cerinus subsp. cerinus]